MSAALAVALLFLWLGMVLAISFIEAPLKFRAPGVTLSIGLGIGRLVFRALNTVEVLLVVALACVAVFDPLPPAAVIAAAVAAAMLAAQLVAVRPRLVRRSDAVLSGDGEHAARSHAHYVYVALELIKVVGLLVAGAALVASF